MSEGSIAPEEAGKGTFTGEEKQDSELPPKPRGKHFKKESVGVAVM